MDAPPAAASGSKPLGRFLTCVGLLWIAGIGLRVTILAVPPLIRLIHDDLHMSETEVGILSGLPLVLFVLAAVPGSLLIARLGAPATLVAGLVGDGARLRVARRRPRISCCCAPRPSSPGLASPSCSPRCRRWYAPGCPTASASAPRSTPTGSWSARFCPVALTLPLVLGLVGGSWRLAFVIWAVPCAVFALLILGLAPRAVVPAGPATPRRWWPDWRSGLIWRLGLMFGANNAIYFSTNAFIPDYLHHLGRPDLIGDTLSALNIGQLPASLILLACAGRLAGRAWPYVACGMLSLACVLGILSGTGWVIVTAAAALGFSGAATLTLMLALPPLLSPPDDVHRMTAAMFTISYSGAVVVPIISGLAWDASGIPAVAFIPIGLCAFLLIGLASTIPRPAR